MNAGFAMIDAATFDELSCRSILLGLGRSVRG